MIKKWPVDCRAWPRITKILVTDEEAYLSSTFVPIILYFFDVGMS